MPSDDVIGAWVRLMRAQHSALSKVEAAIKNAGLPQLSWYDVLLELGRAGDKGLRPFELERELLLPQYGLSRLLDRIEQAGFVERRPCEEDARGHAVCITKSGKAMRRRMWPVYARAIQDAVGAHLSARDAKRLSELLGKLYERRG